MMDLQRVTTRRWGCLQVPQGQLLTFERGWIGFPHLRGFAALDVGARGPLAWLQSLDDPECGAPVTLPECFGVSAHDLLTAVEERFGPEDDTIVLVIATVLGQSPVTGNLQAPLLVDRNTRRGQQVVLDRPDLPLRAEIVAEGAAWHRTLPMPTFRVRCPRVSV
jgi:flagellar assembly factor FliW